MIEQKCNDSWKFWIDKDSENCEFPYARFVLETMGREMIMGSGGLLTAVLNDSAAAGYLAAFAGVCLLTII